ncbi:MAG: cupredoxin domain-containing protein [Thermoleophilia bacterium]|nr:cupredoxin domain-containing protein [Thermoleophilia bacterium]
MNAWDVIVILAGLGAGGLIVWYFWLSSSSGVRVSTVEGVQELTVVVKGGYSPDTIVVQHGRPVRLNFNRQESASCSEMVLFPDFDRSALLPEGAVVPIEFTPEAPGEYGFQCQMGMFKGRLIVE